MGGIGLLVRADVRRRWLALVLIGLLVGSVGAAVTASVAGARRSVTAYERLADLTGQPDATIISFVDPGFLDTVSALPEVEETWPLRAVVGQILDSPEISYLSVIAGPPRPPGLFTPLVIDGRLPDDDEAGEVAVAEGLAREADIALGDRVPLGLLTQEQFESFAEGFGQPDGPTVDLEVVGTFRVAGNDATEQVGILGSPAFAALAEGGGGGDGAMIRLTDVPGAEARFAAGVLEASAEFDLPPEAAELGAYDLKMAVDDRESSIASARVVSRGLLLVGAVGLLVGLLGVVQTLLRHQSRGLGAQPVLGAVGLDRRQRVVASVLPFLVVSTTIAVVVCVGGAIALSPLLPIGSSRRIEPSPGIEVNAAVLAAGAVVSVVVFVAVAGVVALRLVRYRPRAERPGPSLFGRWTRTGVPLPMAIGTGLALDRGRSGSAVSVRAALVGGIVAVATLVGASAFAISLDRLVETPARYGSPGDLLVADARDDLVDELMADPDVVAILQTRGFDLVVDGSRRDALSAEVLEGSIGFNLLDGRTPTGPAEVALGPELADRLEVGVGDRVTIGGAGTPATVVGLVLARGDVGDRYAGSVLVDDEVRRAASGDGAGGGYREVLFDYDEGVDIEAKAAALGETWEVERFDPPRRIADLAQIRNLPLVLAGAAALLGIVLLTHALVVTVRRRGHDLALLRALGGRPRDTMASVLAMTVVIVVIGVLAGIPLGFLLGNLAWRAVAASLYVADDLAVPSGVLAACLPVALGVGLLAAAIPTRRASRLEVAEQLRRE